MHNQLNQEEEKEANFKANQKGENIKKNLFYNSQNSEK